MIKRQNMKVIEISKSKLNSLEKIILDENISNSEAFLYIYNLRANKKVLKIFFISEGLYFNNKILTVNSLIDASEQLGKDQLVIPESFVLTDEKVVGFSMPFIQGINLQTLLKDLNIPIPVKIKYLKEVLKIIEKVQKTILYNQPFHLSDICESNFILDTQLNIVRALDLDGCKIANNIASPVSYLFSNPNVKYLTHKYPTNQYGIHMPNQNSEYFCFILMVLNTIFCGQINTISIPDYYSYLQYLKDLDVSNEILDYFSNIYTSCPNNFSSELLDELVSNEKLVRAHHKVFELINKKSAF